MMKSRLSGGSGDVGRPREDPHLREDEPGHRKKTGTTRIPGIRSRVILLVLGCILPALLISTLFSIVTYHRERERLLRDSISTARALMSSIDQQLAGYQAALLALATSPYLQQQDLAAFYSQAKQSLLNYRAHSIVLIDGEGRQKLNTLRPFNEDLPSAADADLVRRLFETRQSVVSDIFMAPVTQRPIVSISVPVVSGGKVIYQLGMGVLPKDLSAILNEQRLPSGWIGAIIDTSGKIVARTHNMEKFVGSPAAREVAKKIREVEEGVVQATTVEGLKAVVVFSRSKVSGWTVGIAIPGGDLGNEMWQALYGSIVASILLVTASVAFASFIGMRIASTLRELTGPALALGYGGPVHVPHLRLKEAHDIGQALMMASKMLREAQHRAQHDALTGLSNRALFDDIVDQQIAVYERTGTSLTILYLDLDGFKAVNDTYGHQTGDLLLQAVAERLKKAIRATDAAARIGGDEFAVVLAHANGRHARVIAQKIVADLSHPYEVEGRRMSISVSVGVASCPEAGQSREVLLRRADEAMYQAKLEGKERFAVAAP